MTMTTNNAFQQIAKTIVFLLSFVSLADSAEIINDTAKTPIALSGSITADQWDMSHTGVDVTKIKALNTLVNNWIRRVAENAYTKIELQYPGGEEGELWVQELADWLVSLGVPTKSILTVPSSGSDDTIKLSLLMH